MRFRSTRIRPRSLIVATLVLALPACGNTPTEITPLARAAGEVQGVVLRVRNLRPLDPTTQGIYHAWSLLQNSRTELLSPFFVNDAGDIVDEAGAPLEVLTTDDFSVRDTLRLLVTIELPGSVPDQPGGMQVLTGTFIDGVAVLGVPISASIGEASGSLRVFTPTDGPGTNETSGFWFQDDDGAPSIELPDATGALLFETFVEVGGQTLPVGRFESPDEADDANQFSSDLVTAPLRPGEDLLGNAPEGLVFPTDLSGARVTVSLEGRFNDFVTRSQLIVLEAIIPAGVRGGQSVPFINRAPENFPGGQAVLY